MEYIVQELTKEHGWCLWRVCGANREHAQAVLEQEQKNHPEKQFKLGEVESDDCWWNDPFLAN